jgi:hypothetical protein
MDDTFLTPKPGQYYLPESPQGPFVVPQESKAILPISLDPQTRTVLLRFIQGLANTGSLSLVSFGGNATIQDATDDHNMTNGVVGKWKTFTCNTAGSYYFEVSVSPQNATTGCEVILYKNGVQLGTPADEIYDYTFGGIPQSSFTHTFPLQSCVAGDIFDIYGQSLGTNLTVITDARVLAQTIVTLTIGATNFDFVADPTNFTITLN